MHAILLIRTILLNNVLYFYIKELKVINWKNSYRLSLITLTFKANNVIASWNAKSVVDVLIKGLLLVKEELWKKKCKNRNLVICLMLFDN